MDLLLYSFVALALGPLLVLLARRHAWSTVAIDSFCVIAISGFALLHILPDCIATAGMAALPLALIGFIAPTLAERGLRGESRSLRRVVLVLALLGMAAHDTLDGMGLALGHEHGDAAGATHDHSLLAWAVILHRIPEGLGIWWIVPRTLGWVAAVLVTIVTVAATVFGFVVGEDLASSGSTQGLALLQATLAGSLLHVVMHAHIPAPRDRGRWHFASVGGALLAVAMLWLVMANHGHVHVHDEGAAGGDHVHGTLHTFVDLAIESAPALLLAYLLVGLCQTFLPAGWLQRMNRGSTLSQALRGVAIGMPLPVCSCGVLPIYRELIRQGTSVAAAVAFLIATPELEVAAVLLTWQLLGGEVAAVRVAAAAALALLVGMLAARWSRRGEPVPPAPAAEPAPPQSFGSRLGGALRFGFGPAVDNTASWILLGLLLSALAVPYIDRDWIAALPPGIDVPIAALLGLPLYVCATGSTPLAAVLLAQGLSPGAVIAFLLTGPATNFTTFGLLSRLHGGRMAFAFGATMWVGAVGLGFLVNLLLPGGNRVLHVGDDHTHHHHGMWGQLALGALALVFLWSLLRQGVRPFLERLFESPANVDAGGHGHDGGHGHEGHDHDGHHHHGHGHGHAKPHDCCDH